MRRVLSVLSVLAVTAGMPAGATTVVPADFAEMVADSHQIVHGTVIGVEAYTTGSRRDIETVVTLAVAGAIKGAPATRLSFRVPGGQIGRYRRVMVGAPRFEEGDEVVLFLKGRAPALPMPFGLSQGVYRVNRETGRALVTPLMTTDAGRIVRGDPARRPLALDAFARSVREAMERP